MKTIVGRIMTARGIFGPNSNQVIRPWGSYECICRDDGFQVKRTDH